MGTEVFEEVFGIILRIKLKNCVFRNMIHKISMFLYGCLFKIGVSFFINRNNILQIKKNLIINMRTFVFENVITIKLQFES